MTQVLDETHKGKDVDRHPRDPNPTETLTLQVDRLD